MADVPPIPPEVLIANLQAARLAYHNLMIGGGVQDVSVDGYMTKFTRTNASALQSYIATLTAQIAGRPARGAIGFTF